MAQNTTNEYRKFRYYEGVCSSSDFIKEIAKVVSLGVKSDPVKNDNGEIIQAAQPLKSKNWDIVYPMVDSTFPEYSKLNSRDKYLDPNEGVDSLSEESRLAKLENQINQITDTVVLRTKTTVKNISEDEIDDLTVSTDSDKASTTMYVQFYKPKYLANPEEYPLDAELHGLTPQLITKDMYEEARKAKASVIIDLTKLEKEYKKPIHEGIITSEKKDEQVDSISNALSLSYLFDSETGILNGLAAIKNIPVSQIEDIIAIPTTSERVSTCKLNHSQLNTIKQEQPDLYNFLFGICGLKTSFTVNDWNNIDEMTISITLSGTTESDQVCYVNLYYNKMVTIYSVNPKQDGTCYINVKEEYLEIGNKSYEALENIVPELYSEGRYIKLPDKYLQDPSKDTVTFNPSEKLRFCIDKVKDDSILYGTLVIRLQYDKELNYTDISSLQITDSITLPNNHYCLVRMFDNPSEDFSGPEPNIEDSDGNVTVTNSHTSPWSKLSWYQDFEEIMMDHIDEDISVTSISDGTLYVPLETTGLSADTRISYWINTNNDRFSLIVMGNPALDYERNRHLISSCYIGRIDSFEHSINDVSGNFALYTSSSTTPCNTTMNTNITQYHINRKFENGMFLNEQPGLYIVDEDPDNFPAKYDIGNNGNDDKSEIKNVDGFERNLEGNIEAYMKHCTEIGGNYPWTKLTNLGFITFYINITGNRFFNEDEAPRYMVIKKEEINGETKYTPLVLAHEKDGTPIYYRPVANYRPIYGANDSRTNDIAVYIVPLDDTSINEDNCTVYFNFGYHEEKFVITSGISRDVFGNVIGIDTIDSYGKNTSDGTTSVSMYHTRSKAFYQKHHFLFATTEEYMSKVLYGKSSYTGEYYADRIKITHGNDGPRGILSDVLVIDSSSLYPKDELVINKDFEKNPDDLEETFTYFPVTAPFSPLSDGPNSRYGIALKKAEREPDYLNTDKILNIALDELRTIMVNNQVVETDNVILPEKTSNGCEIFWEVLCGRNWMETEQGKKITLKFADNETRSFTVTKYKANNIEIFKEKLEMEDENLEDANKIEVELSKVVKITNGQEDGFEKTKHLNINFQIEIEGQSSPGYEIPDTVTKIVYGYSDEEITGIKKGSTIISRIPDAQKELHEYSFIDNPVDTSNQILIDDNKIEKEAGQTENTILIKKINDLNVYNAHPSKYLNIFFIENKITGSQPSEEQEGEEIILTDPNTDVISSFISVALTKDIEHDTKDNLLFNKNNIDNEDIQIENSYFDLLQYPCTINVFISGITNSNEEGILYNSSLYSKYQFSYLPYDEQQVIYFKNINGTASFILSDYTQPYIVTETVEENGETTTNILADPFPTKEISGSLTIDAKQMIDDMFINIQNIQS